LTLHWEAFTGKDIIWIAVTLVIAFTFTLLLMHLNPSLVSRAAKTTQNT
jgi:hypothetical protein